MLPLDLASIDFICPRCHGDLESNPDEHRCLRCSAVYPVVLGIPDFRVEPDPWISLDDDRAKARRLIENTDGLGLERSVEAYWAMTPGTSAADARRFIEYVLAGERRAEEWLDSIDPPVTSPSNGTLIEIGCASGDLLSVCARRGVPAVGVDVAMRWLVLARKRPSLANGAQPVVCANGEWLPFRDHTFTRAVSAGTLEHCRRAEDVLAQCARVVRHGGPVNIRTTNRFTALREPHVNIWGVGFVPRRLADRYVRALGGQGYDHHRPLSSGELNRAIRKAGLVGGRVTPAPLLPSDRTRLGAGAALLPAYDWARSTPILSASLSWIAPLLEATGRVA